MKNFNLIIMVFIVLSCQSKGKKTHIESDKMITKDISVSEFQKMSQDSGAIILDVRTTEEYESGHLENAQSINWYESNFSAEVGKLDKNKTVFVYCRSGGRSGQAMKKMKDLGFTKIYNMIGGIGAWNSNNFALIK